MPRTSASAVKAILLKDYPTKRAPSLDPFIRAAGIIVDRLAVADSTIEDPVLLEIETWVAAHAYCMSDQTYTQKQTGNAMGSFHGKTGMYLEATKYGQMAVLIDPSGKLAEIATGTGPNMAGGFWLGKTAS